MVDETIVPATPAPAVDAAAAAPTTPNPTESPAVETVTAPATEAKPVEQPAVATNATGSPETPVAEKPPENPLGAEPSAAKTETKVEAPKVEAKPETPPEPVEVKLPTYEEFKLPENFKLEKEPVDSLTKILGEIETGKLDHAAMQAKGQQLVDLGTKLVTDSINRLNDSYVQIHQSNVKARVDALKADPVMGGDNFDKTVSALQASIREYGGTEAQVAEFRKEVTESGLGASPALCRLIYNMQQKINKYTTEGDGNRLVPASKPAPTKVKPYQAFYQGNG